MKTFNPLTDLGLEFSIPDNDTLWVNNECTAEVKADNGCTMKIRCYLSAKDPEWNPSDAAVDIFTPDGEFIYGDYIRCVEDYQFALKELFETEYTYFGKVTITKPDGTVSEQELYLWADKYFRENGRIDVGVFV